MLHKIYLRKMVCILKRREMPDSQLLTDWRKKYDLAVSAWSYISLGLNIATHILIILACIKCLRNK